MTLVCAGGSSAPKPGTAASVVVDTRYIQSILPPGLSQLFPYLPFMQGLVIGDVGAFCSIDPPTWTVPGPADFLAFLTGGPLGNYQLVNDFLQSLTRAYLWYGLCQCGTGTPTPITPPTLPPGLPALNPGTVTSLPGSDGCYALETDVSNAPNAGLYFPAPGGWVRPPSNATMVRMTVTNTSATNQLLGFAIQSFPDQTFNFGGTNVVIRNTPVPAGQTVSLQSTTLNLAQFFTAEVSWGAVTPGPNFHLRWEFFCGGAQPGTVSTPCCVPDPILMGMLERILTTTTLLQRQVAPFAYVSGPAHHALVGTSTLAVQGILGVLLNVSAPARAGLLAGTPPTVYDVGWINFGTADGYTEKVVITSGSELVFPRAPGLYTLVGYTFLPGVVVTLTELVREP